MIQLCRKSVPTLYNRHGERERQRETDRETEEGG